MPSTLNVSVIGFGMAARVFHLPVIQSVPTLRLKTIVERSGDEARQRYPAAEIVREATAVWQDPTIDLVVITTPNPSHFDLARQALLANKHVVVEKPFTTTSAEAQQLIDLAQQKNRVLSVHHNRRWDNDFLTVRKIIEGNYLGQLVEYEAHYDRFRPALKTGAWREAAQAGSGILFDLGAHLIDQAQVLFGLPQALTADIRTQRVGAQADDNFELIFHYPDLKVTLKAGMLVREPGPRFTLHGTAGSFVKYGLDPQEEALKQGRSPSETNWGLEPQAQWGRLNTQFNGLHFEGQIETLAGCYPAFYQNVADAITGQAELIVKPEQAHHTIRLIELALESNRQRRTVEVDR